MDAGQKVVVSFYARRGTGKAAQAHPRRYEEGTVVRPVKRTSRYVVRFRRDGGEEEVHVRDLRKLDAFHDGLHGLPRDHDVGGTA